jgi:methionyl-tRNA synthetase
LYTALELSACLSYLMEPFLPFTAMRLREMLNLPAGDWTTVLGKTILTPGHALGTSALLFDKIEDEAIAHQVQKLEATKAEKAAEVTTPEPVQAAFKESTTYDDFTKMDLRVGTILAAEKVEKADKLLKLTIDTGLDQRTVVSGIALHYSPEEIIGKQVTLLANLAPRKIRGIESMGMILMAEDADGKLVFIQPSQATKAGSTIS